MTSSGENGQGLQHNQLTEEAYSEMLDRMGHAGWAFAGGEGDDLPYQIGIARLEGRGNMSVEEAIVNLDLADEKGDLLPGYEVTTDDNGQLALGYEGPGNSRYVQFLGDVAALGDHMDKTLIKNSPYPEALEQWQLRHELWAERRTYESLEPHVGNSMKALRDHVVIEEGGVTRLVELLVNGASSTTIHGTHERFTATAEKMEAALAAKTPAERDSELDLALQDADTIISATVEGYEVRALGVPGVTAAFAREVLVDNPLYGRDPISEDELDELLAFEDSPVDGNGSGRTKELKVTRLGKILYHMHTSIDAQGVHQTLTGSFAPDFLDGKTPREVIDSGTAEENEALLNWAVGMRGMTAS